MQISLVIDATIEDLRPLQQVITETPTTRTTPQTTHVDSGQSILHRPHQHITAF